MNKYISVFSLLFPFLVSQYSLANSKYPLQRSAMQKCNDFADLVSLHKAGIKDIVDIKKYKNVYQKKFFWADNTQRNRYLAKVGKAIIDSGFNLKEPHEIRTKLEVHIDSLKELYLNKHYDLCAWYGEEFFESLDKINMAGEWKGPVYWIKGPISQQDPTIETKYNMYRFGRKSRGI